MAAPMNTTSSVINRSDVQSPGGLKVVVSGPRLTRVAVAVEMACIAAHLVVSTL